MLGAMDVEGSRNVVPTSRISVTATADRVVVTVLEPLRAEAAPMLLQVVYAAVEAKRDGQRVEIDLRDIESCSVAGLAALTACARLGAEVRGGVRFRVGSTARRGQRHACDPDEPKEAVDRP